LSRGYEVYIKEARRVKQYLDNYLEVAKEVKRIVRALLPEAEVYVFGSVVEGKATPASDIDILVVASEITLEERAAIRAEVVKKLDNPPVELHFVTLQEYENWYKRFVKKIVKI